MAGVLVIEEAVKEFLLFRGYVPYAPALPCPPAARPPCRVDRTLLLLDCDQSVISQSDPSRPGLAEKNITRLASALMSRSLRIHTPSYLLLVVLYRWLDRHLRAI
jgi:hypothetical protein